ncbi:MAG TPA: DUF3192 domain-containing protein [Candidatus Limnocylindrales bacterium]|nr:DUF3192 domain-containing protein [Candidatus Limnocylindrales bacterium]
MKQRFLCTVMPALVMLLAGCAQTHVDRYHQAVRANRDHIAEIRAGMTRPEVESVMGQGPVVEYKKIELRNPWRTDSYRRDGRSFDVLYYVTHGDTWKKFQPDEQLLTPVVLEEGKVVGTGWTLVDKAPRYVSGPPDGPSQEASITSAPGDPR